MRINQEMGARVHASRLMGQCFQVVVGGEGRQPRVVLRAAHGEMVKALKGVVREAINSCTGSSKKQPMPVALTL